MAKVSWSSGSETTFRTPALRTPYSRIRRSSQLATHLFAKPRSLWDLCGCKGSCCASITRHWAIYLSCTHSTFLCRLLESSQKKLPYIEKFAQRVMPKNIGKLLLLLCCRRSQQKRAEGIAEVRAHHDLPGQSLSRSDLEPQRCLHRWLRGTMPETKSA